MIVDIMKYCNNYFAKCKFTGKFGIEDSTIIVPGVLKNVNKCDYVKMATDNDNEIYKIGEVLYDEELKKTYIKLEDFDSFSESDYGVIYFSLVPKRIKDLADKINKEVLTNDLLNPAKNIITSESLGNYSYSKKTTKDGSILTWKEVYKEDLKPYRKMYSGLEYVMECK